MFKREQGKRTPMSSKKKQSSSKLVSDTKKFIRTDFGGRERREVLAARLQEMHPGKFNAEDAAMVIDFVLAEIEIQRQGIVKRVTPNLEILSERK
jgi:hypothetical protein